MDGSGYPSGLHCEDILLEARILAVADVVEAMSSHRPYRPAYPTDKALLEIVQKRAFSMIVKRWTLVCVSLRRKDINSSKGPVSVDMVM
jgi:HD-GYP domain-containing protein (c-di-GMP phosphodiesterase class II)